jgi:hypothetical protein
MITKLLKGTGCIKIPLIGQTVTINGVMYKQPVVSARLLTANELDRLTTFDLGNPEARFVVEDEMLEDIVEGFVGIHGIIDWDEMEAGSVDAITNGVAIASISYAQDPVTKFNEAKQSVTLLHNMQAIVARFLSVSYLDVEKLPINEVFRLYAICRVTFPNEVKDIEITEQNVTESDD